MAYEPIDILKVDISRINLKPAKQDEKSKKIGRMFGIFHGEQRLEIILPELNAPFGPKKLEDFVQDGQLPKTSITVSFDGINEETSRGARLRAAHEKLVQIQNKIVDLMTADSQKFFIKDKGPVARAEVQRRFSPIIWSPEVKEDGSKYADTFRVNLQLYNPTIKEKEEKSPDELTVLRKRFTSKPGYPLVLDKMKKEIPVNFDSVEKVLYKHCRVKIIAGFSFLWVSSSSKATVNITWLHGRIVSDPPKPNLNLLDDSDEELSVKKVKIEEAGEEEGEEVVDDDDEEDEEDEDSD